MGDEESIKAINAVTTAANICLNLMTSNQTDTPPYSPELFTFFSGIYALIAVMGISGNTFVISVILTDDKLRKSLMNIILLELAVADQLNLVSCIPDIIANLTNKWYLDEFACKLLRFLELFALYASLWLQIALCLERFLVIIYPLHASFIGTKARVLIILKTFWFIAFVTASPQLVWTSIKCRSCWTEASNPTAKQWMHVYKVVQFFTYYMVPALLFLVLYTKISITLRAQATMTLFATPCDRITQAIMTKRRNVVRTLVACVVVYFICYTPIQIMWVLNELSIVDGKKMPQAMWTLLNAFTYLSAAANPTLYLVCIPTFRSKLIKTFRWCVGRSENNTKLSLTGPTELNGIDGKPKNAKVAKCVSGNGQTLPLHISGITANKVNNAEPPIIPVGQVDSCDICANVQNNQDDNHFEISSQDASESLLETSEPQVAEKQSLAVEKTVSLPAYQGSNNRQEESPGQSKCQTERKRNETMPLRRKSTWKHYIFTAPRKSLASLKRTPKRSMQLQNLRASKNSVLRGSFRFDECGALVSDPIGDV